MSADLPAHGAARHRVGAAMGVNAERGQFLQLSLSTHQARLAM